MKNEIKVPSLGESISEATIGQILAPTGTHVQVDDEVLELETDKVNQVLYAPQAGKIVLNVKTGETVKIGQTIGIIEILTETVSKEEVPIANLPKESSAPLTSSEEVPSLSTPPVNLTEKGIRYTKENFLADLKTPEKPMKLEPQVEELKTPLAKQETRRPLSKIRKVIAQRLVEAQRTMAMLTTFNEVDLTQVIQLREKYKELFAQTYQCKLGFMSFFIKATLSALQAFPSLNSYLDGEEVVQRHYYDIGVAVGTDKGVIVPVIRQCDQLSFAQIEQMLENYAKKAREGTLAVNDLQGGGFTITNGGVYGSLLSTPILLPPQCGILGMHKIEKRAVVIQDQITIRPMMYVALSYDHRLIDGKEAVSFLVHIKEMLEEPSRFLLEI